MSRPPNKPLPPGRLNFLLGASDNDLSSFELARLAAVANIRKGLIEAIDRMVDELSQAAIARWFRTQDRVALKNAIENPAEAIERIVALAKEQIRDGQRSDEELIPRAPLPPGAAQLAASLRYQERNVEKGLCAVCPKPLAKNSIRFCERHLTIARLRHKPKGAKGFLPGSIDWLYGDGVFESVRTPSLKQRAKQHRSIPAEKALYDHVAKQLGMSPEHVRAVALGQRRSRGVLAALNEAMAGALKKANERKSKKGRAVRLASANEPEEGTSGNGQDYNLPLAAFPNEKRKRGSKS